MNARLLNISESLSLALHSLRIISASDGTVNALEISKKTGMSINHLSKVLRKLAVGGILNVSKGPGGGFYLSQEQREKSLMDVYLLFEQMPIDKACIYENPLCDKKKCVFGGLLCRVNDEFIKHFNDTKIGSLA